jgi:YVTN family beta-propeller protein
MSVTLTVNAATASAGSAAMTTNLSLVSPRFAYVTNAFAPGVAVVDTATNQVTATIDFPAGSVPFAAAMSPDLEKVYVTSLDAFSTCGDNTGVFVIDTASSAIAAGPIAVGCEPTGIAITPDGQRAYVASQLGDSISVIDTATDSGGATIPLPDGGGLSSIAISPDGLRAYATALGQSPVLVIDISSNTVFGAPIDAGTNSSGIAISPNGALAYVANMNSSGGVTAIDTATNTVIATIALDNYPSAVAFTPDGTLAYVSQAGINSNGEFTVSMIDTASHAVVGSPITVGSFPTSIAITADGMQAYVGNEGSSTVSVIDTASNTVTTTLGGMNSPRGIAARPLAPAILVPVPDVVGATQSAAASAITDAGLVVGTVTQQASITVASGSVISQDPVAGVQVAGGSAVNLVVSSGATA